MNFLKWIRDLEPRLVVLIPLSAPAPDRLSPSAPWNDQDMVRGWSPEVTMQEIWAKSPSFITSFAKANAPISGSSEHKNMFVKTMY